VKAEAARKPNVRTVIMTPLLARLKSDKAFRNRILSIIPAAISKTIYAQPETSLDALLCELFPLEVKILKLNYDETRLFCLAARVLNVPHQNSDRVAVHPIELLPPPNEPGHWVEKGKVLNDLGFKWNAVRCYEKAIKMDARCAEAYCQKGNSLFQLGRITTVIEGPDETRAAHPVWNQLEHLRATLQEAIDCFDQAIRINPRYTEAIYLKGACLIELGRPGGDRARVRQAVACFRQVLSIDPTHANARWALQICHETVNSGNQGDEGLGGPEQKRKP